MPSGEYAVMQAESLLALPASPHADPKRALLAEYLRNPFLDDDASALSLRLGLDAPRLESAAAALCDEGLLRGAGRRGYLLDLEGVGGEQLVAAGALAAELLAPPADPAAALGVPSAPSVGFILMRADGSVELVDEQVAEWLGVPADFLDGDAFEAATGIDPGLMLGGAPKVSFSLAEPRPLEVTMHACCLGGEPGVLIALRDSSQQDELTGIHAQMQEELFSRLRGDIVEPMLLIRHFLDNPDPEGLGQARAALEQVNGFLDDFLLGDRRADPGPERD